MTPLSRRGLLGILAVAAAPAIIRTPGLLMPIKPKLVADPEWFTVDDRYVGSIILPSFPQDGDMVTMDGRLWLVTTLDANTFSMTPL